MSIDQTWKDLQAGTKRAVTKTFPIEGRHRRLVLHSVTIDETSADSGDIRGQEIAKDRGRNWGATVYGDVSLIDKKTGKVIDRAKTKLMTLPKPTGRYSYIVNGNEYQVSHLWKLKSGVYSMIKQNGDLETEFNLGSVEGKPALFARESILRVPFSPKTKKFKFKWKDNNIDLYSVLKVLGVQDEDMKKAWGSDIYKANATNEGKIQQDIERLYKKVKERGVVAKGEKYDDIASAIVSEFGKTKLDPQGSKKTLGIAASEVDGAALLQASKRILQVSRGDELPDDRDSLAFKRLVGIDNFVEEKISKPVAMRTIHNKARNNIDRKDKVREIITSDMFSKPMTNAFTGSMGRNDDQINPLEMISGYRQTTTLGGDVGGIKGDEKLTTAMKLINPSHMGFLDPIHTPESSKTGINLRMPLGVTKDGEVPKVLAYDTKEGKIRSGKQGVSPTEMQEHNVVLPDQITWVDGKPKPISKLVKMKMPSGEIRSLPFKEARFVFLSPHQLFDEATNLIPFLQNDQGNRTMVASRQGTQAVGLTYREAPLVQVQAGKNSTWERTIGIPFSHPSPVSGEVVRIRSDRTENEYPDSIIIKDDKGKKHEIQLYNHFPLNEARSFMHSTPSVKKGDKVKRGQTLADTNFTREGVLSLGTNLTVSYLPYKGYNFEDGIVISESAAKKLTSEEVYRNRVEIDPKKDFLNKKKFQAYASTVAKGLTQKQLDSLDDDGIIMLGSKVEPGDMLIAAVGKRENTGIVSKMSSRLSKGLFQYGDKSARWEGDGPGVVVKVKKHPGNKWAEVHVRTSKAAEVGDKIVGRHGNKGIITKILPNHAMPRIGSPDGEHTEVLLNPSGVPSRINLGQMLETAASKIARKTGKIYVVNNFDTAGIDYTEKVKRELAEHGLSDKEVLFDPRTKKELGKVLTGDQYIMKLKHQVEKKLSARSYGPNYTLEGAPKAGGTNPGMAIGQLEFYSLLAHGARANLREIATYKADRQVDEQHNPQAHVDFWERVKMGQPIPPPRPTFAYKKFENYLNALGIDVRKDGHELQLVPLTDKGVLNLSNGEIKDPGLVLRGKDAKELEKGLFDPTITGGLPDPNDSGKGLNWSHITLAEPMPNPVFVGTSTNPGPAVVLTGLKFSEFEDVVKGKIEINGRTGGAAIKHMLDQVDVAKELQVTLDSLPTLRREKLNKANKKAKYLRALQDLKKRGLVKGPSEAYIMHHVPVLPPVMRPIVPMPDGSLRFDDINHLYQSLGIVNNKLKDKVKEIPELEQKLREELYDILKATAGIGGVAKFESNRKLKGILDTIAGDSPKQGFFQKRLMKRRQELSMRSTIIPEPAMHLDNLGLPKSAALEMYKPFVIRELVFAGFQPLDAHRAVKEESVAAIKALEKAMSKRPVLLKRDPALHKFSFMAFKPKIVEGKAIRIHPLVTAGYNADFDGDAMSAFVPLTEEAADEAHKMFPSNNLFSSTTGGVMYSPTQDSLLGLHLLSKWGKSTKKGFSNFAEATQAHHKGVIQTDDVITVGGKRTTLGRLMLVDKLPKDYQKNRTILHDSKFILKSNTLKDMMADIARTDPKKFAFTVDKLKDLGDKHVYESGFSIGLDDLTVPKKARDAILARADVKADMVNAMKIPVVDKDKRLIKIYEDATKEMEKKLKPYFAASDNNLFVMVDSGARGKWSQFRQMNIAPMLMQDATGRTLPTPVRKSYSEGLDVGDYWTAMHGARMGTLQRAEGTSEPGNISKQLANTLISELIVSNDCGTSEGVAMNISDDDVHDRYLAKSIKAGSRRFAVGSLVTPHMTSALKKGGVSRIVVRSPLKCQHGSGICAKCFGLSENGRDHDVGTNIGIMAGHSMGEPAMQLAMDCNAAGNIVTARILEKTFTLTFEQLWNRVSSSVDVEGDVETKIPDSLEVWDHTKFVSVRVLQRHKPHSPMVLVRLKSGHSFVCQSTHPNWARKAVALCPHCAEEEPVSFSSHYDSGDKTSVRCSSCRNTFPILRSLYEDQQERIVRSVDLVGHFLGFSPHCKDSAACGMPLPPYLLGAYLAEGNVKRTKVVSKIKDGAKRRHQVATGMIWKVLGVVITQNKGEVRDQLIDELLLADIAFVEPSDKHIQLGDVRLARSLWRLCGVRSHNKSLPPGWTAQSDEWKKDFLAGLLDGDGTRVEGHTAALDTTSWSLVCQVQEIVRSLRGFSVVYATTVKELTRHQGYRVTIDLSFRLPTVKDFPSVECCEPIGHYSKVVQVKEIEFYTDWTYDLATDTKGFTASGIRTHNSFHTGGVAASRGGAATNRLDRLKQLLNPPEKLPGSALLAKNSGKIHKIEKDRATKGWNIWIGKEKHFAPAQRSPMHKGRAISIGKVIQKGDTLTDGLINPRELLPLTDVPTVQRYMVDELYNGIYKDERVRRRNIEMVVRSLTNLAQVTDGGDSDRLAGDFVLRTIIEEENRNALKGTAPIKVTPLMKGLRQGSLDVQEDWMARLNFQRLKDTLLQGASKGWRTNLHGSNPVPAYVFGAEFGQGPNKATY